MKLGVCVPYRNREAHLFEFVSKVAEYLKSTGIDDFCMYFGHQCDDKLFNRGMTKNIAAKYAFEDGCDYIVWHDIDMIPELGGGADYSYPKEHPVHIATNISQMNYELKYFEYFGGAVLFTKEQVEKTNGYSNEYWDWGMEDDDLFWRCYLEGMLDYQKYKTEKNCTYAHFNGDNSSIEIPASFGLRNFNSRSHTVSILCRAFQQPHKQEIYLLGDKNRQYIEYPILRLPGYDYGISFNNSKSLNIQFWNTFNQHNYMWVKRYDRQWSWITVTFDTDEQLCRFYLNGEELDASKGYGSESPYKWVGRLKSYGNANIYLGTTPSLDFKDTAKFFKGDIAKVQIWDRALDSEEIALMKGDITVAEDDLLLDLNFRTGFPEYVIPSNVDLITEDVDIYGSIVPFRKSGRFTCLYHKDEGIVDGKFAKGEPTARNEKRYMLAMQQGKINYKEDGIAQLDGKYEYLGTDQLTPRAKMINVKF